MPIRPTDAPLALRVQGGLGLLLGLVLLAACGLPTAPAPTQAPTASAPTAGPPAPTAPPPAATQPPAPSPEPAASMPLPAGWIEQVTGLLWTAYSPPGSDPNLGEQATTEAMRRDLAHLRQVGFTGLVTYSSAGSLGRELPALAEEAGFQGLIVGVWDPASEEEQANAAAAAASRIVLGTCVGNEGWTKRYDTAALVAAVDAVRRATGKPVATTEEIDDYADPALLGLGDWVFPNAHPYFHGQLDPELAVRWTQAAYEDLLRRTDRFVWFKEVGLPTEGDDEGRLSEANQAAYYAGLADTPVRFVYFEGFDQPWKTHLPVEPHWGLLRADGSPKLAALRLMGVEPTPTPPPLAPSDTPAPTPSATPTQPPAFYVYRDADSPDRHFSPSGYMGDTGDIHVNEAHKENPFSGQTSIRVTYDAQGKGPNECSYAPPCKWAGVYWLEPPSNWGTDAAWSDKGFDLSGSTRLRFAARADRPTTIEFKVGGVNNVYGDSLVYPRTLHADLTTRWQEFEIDLRDADLHYIIGGFAWVTNTDANPKGITFYLDEIRFER